MVGHCFLEDCIGLCFKKLLGVCCLAKLGIDVLLSASFKLCFMFVLRSSVLEKLSTEVRTRFLGCAMSEVATVASSSESGELVELAPVWMPHYASSSHAMDADGSVEDVLVQEARHEVLELQLRVAREEAEAQRFRCAYYLAQVSRMSWLVCLMHTSMRRRLCQLCRCRRALPSCYPERCWIPYFRCCRDCWFVHMYKLFRMPDHVCVFVLLLFQDNGFTWNPYREPLRLNYVS